MQEQIKVMWKSRIWIRLICWNETLISLEKSVTVCDVIPVLFSMPGLGFTYERIKLKKSWTIIIGIVFSQFAAYCFYRFFKRNLAEIQLALAEWMNASIIDRLF